MVDGFGETVKRLRTERGIGLRELARAVPIDPGHLSRIEHGVRPATPEIVAAIEAALWDDELDSYELAQRAQSSDVGATALTGLESAFDRLATAYQRTSPAVLLPDVRRQLGYVARFLDKRATLAQRRRLLVVGGWLSLLAATLQIDLHQRGAAAARLRTAEALARQAEHREIEAWVLETRAGTR